MVMGTGMQGQNAIDAPESVLSWRLLVHCSFLTRCGLVVTAAALRQTVVASLVSHS